MRRDRAVLAEILERALPPSARRRIFSVDLVGKRWASVVGDEIARRAEPEALEGGVLTVRVTDPAWGQMVVKLQGQFPWHKHDDTDDFFLVLKGEVIIRLRDGDVTLKPGEIFVVPMGVEHAPYAEEEAHVLLIEPTGTPNTGDPATAAPRREI